MASTRAVGPILLTLLVAIGSAFAGTNWDGTVEGTNDLGIEPVLDGQKGQQGTATSGFKTLDASNPAVFSQPCEGIELTESIKLSVSGFADYGVVHMMATGVAENTPGQYNCGVGAQASPLVAKGQADSSAGFDDVLTVDSPTLPPGTAVEVVFTMKLDGTIGADDGNPSGPLDGAFAYFSIGPTTELGTGNLQGAGEASAAPLPTHAVHVTKQTSTMVTIPASGVFNGGGQVRIRVKVSPGFPSSHAAADFSSTAHFFVDSPTPGVVITSASGHDYRSVDGPPTISTTTTTLAGGSTTSTTLPGGGCTGAQGQAAIDCVCAAGLPAACAGSSLPASIANGVPQACSAAHAGAAASGKKARRRLLARASKKVAKLVRIVARPAVARKLTPACVEALHSTLDALKTGIGGLRAP